MAKNTVLTLKKKVDEGGKVTMVTSYDYTMRAVYLGNLQSYKKGRNF